MEDRVIESVEFSLWVWNMKATCIAVGVEGSKQVVQEQVHIRKFNHGEPSSVVEQTQAMHASVKAFMEIDFSSYLRLGELNLEGIHQLCSNHDAEWKQP